MSQVGGDALKWVGATSLLAAAYVYAQEGGLIAQLAVLGATGGASYASMVNARSHRRTAELAVGASHPANRAPLQP
jgi:hypothetical protein